MDKSKLFREQNQQLSCGHVRLRRLPRILHRFNSTTIFPTPVVSNDCDPTRAARILFFFQRLFLKTVSKRIFLCWLAHCGSFDPCSMFKERQQRYWRGLPRDGDPGSVLIHFTLWMVAIRGVGREKFEFVASRAFDDTEYFLGVGVIKGR